MATVPQGNVRKPRFGPSDGLIAMFRACSKDPTEAIVTRLRRLLDMFLQHHNEGNETTKELATKCWFEARIWYFRILENLISGERKRPGISDISSVRRIQGFLESDIFQCSLVACCLEITITLNQLPCDFPQLLHILKLSPYHFQKVIKPVLHAEVGLPAAVVKHLSQVEEKVLESLAWTSNSPLWEEIRANEGQLPTCRQVMPPAQLEDPTRTDVQPDPDLPREDASTGTDPSTSTDRQRLPSALTRPGRSSLHGFAYNVYSLMGQRLRELCSTLDISDDLRLKIWTCFEHSLVNCTFLMADRHLDQLLMCAIYIIPKITKPEILFKHIMNCYKSQPHTSKSVCKNVLISGGGVENTPTENNDGDHSSATLTPDTPSTHYKGPCQETKGNLIYFYNQVYISKMEHFANQFAPSSGGETPPRSPYPRRLEASPRKYRLTSGHSIFISLRKAQNTSPFTSSISYTFNSSPSERLREINNMIKAGGPPNRRGYAIRLDTEDKEEDGPSAKRLRLDGPSAWHRRLRDVANERVLRRNQDQDQDQVQDQVEPSPVRKPNLH